MMISFAFDQDYQGDLKDYLMEWEGQVKIPSCYIKHVIVEYSDGDICEFIGFTTPYISSTGKELEQFTENGKKIIDVFVVIDSKRVEYRVGRMVDKLFEDILTRG